MSARIPGTLPGLLGIEITSIDATNVRGQLTVRPDLLAPNGFLHGATVVALADTVCGFGAFANKPPEATGFTTIELKTNYLGTAREGRITCEATLLHGGRTTQVWDATVYGPNGKPIAVFRCTQLLLYPRG
ncbi:MAG: competence protein ComA [Chloroflexi bacterium]|nr:MAG: competence protein ComA [Chloroflexota bacterium]